MLPQYHPCDPSAYFAMLVYKNGSLSREAVRDRRAGGSWERFSALLRESTPGNGGKLGLYLDSFEITPQIDRTGAFRVAIDGEGLNVLEDLDFDDAEEVRAIIEGRFLR